MKAKIPNHMVLDFSRMFLTGRSYTCGNVLGSFQLLSIVDMLHKEPLVYNLYHFNTNPIKVLFTKDSDEEVSKVLQDEKLSAIHFGAFSEKSMNLVLSNHGKCLCTSVHNDGNALQFSTLLFINAVDNLQLCCSSFKSTILICSMMKNYAPYVWKFFRNENIRNIYKPGYLGFEKFGPELAISKLFSHVCHTLNQNENIRYMFSSTLFSDEESFNRMTVFENKVFERVEETVFRFFSDEYTEIDHLIRMKELQKRINKRFKINGIKYKFKEALDFADCVTNREEMMQNFVERMMYYNRIVNYIVI